MIRINRIKLLNFMCCSAVNLDFTDRDIVILSGKNGQGKSTIFDALAFSFASVKRADKAQEYIKKGESYAIIYVNATFNNEIIEITTNLNLVKDKGTMEKTVTYKGVTYKNTEANNILKTLKFDFYTNILFSMQDGEKISDMTPSVRSEYLKNVMNINFSDEISVLNEQISTLSDRCSRTSTEKMLLEKQLQDNQSEIEKIEKSIKEYPYSKEKYNSYKKELKSVSDEIIELGDNSSSEEVETLKKEIKEKENTVYEIKQKIDEHSIHRKENDENLKKKQEFSEKIKNLESQINDDIDENNISEYKLQIDKLSECLKSVDTELNDLKYSLRDKRKYMNMSLQDVQTEYSLLLKELEPMVSDREEILSNIKGKEEERIINEQKIKELKSQINELKDKDRCPTCKQLVPEDLVGIFKERLEEANRKSETLKNDLKDINKYLDNYDKSVALQKDIEILKELETNKSRIAELEKYRESYDRQTSEIHKKISDIDAKKFEQKSILEKIDFYNKELSNLKFWELENIDDEEKEYSSIKSKLEELKDVLYKKISENNSKVSNLIKQQKFLQDEINKCDIIKQENDSLFHTKTLLENKAVSMSEQIKSLSENLSIDTNNSGKYSLALNILAKDLPNHILLFVSKTLQDMMNTMMGRIMGNLKCRLLKEKAGVEFFYSFTNKNIETMNKRELLSVKMASGFEKSLLTIVFKMALCKIYGLGFALLDEIDCYSDDENSENLFNMILGSGITEQVFIITHKPYTKNLLQNFSNKSVIYSVKNGVFSEVE